MNQSEMARLAGVDTKTITNIKRRLGIKGTSFTLEQQEAILKEAKASSDLTKEAKFLKVVDVPVDTRKISDYKGSVVELMLEDAKNRYDKNEAVIARLDNELEQVGQLFRGNQNGTLQSMPQLTMTEKFQKLNIALRKQIAELEGILNVVGSNEDDPFK